MGLFLIMPSGLSGCFWLVWGLCLVDFDLIYLLFGLIFLLVVFYCVCLCVFGTCLMVCGV